MSDLKKYIERQMDDPEFAEEYEAIRPIENGTSSPTVDTLARIAAGMGKQLKIEFV